MWKVGGVFGALRQTGRTSGTTVSGSAGCPSKAAANQKGVGESSRGAIAGEIRLRRVRTGRGVGAGGEAGGAGT